ncbi:ceramide-1-phosphate transfer protein isoform X2 [Cebus imitator]|nr:ceramide-1-phosphate transfer protein isoform X2 [Cebus imitator]XP_037599412.1 ceramide-1-phosphate transfer protein isoform X2 [Cebus imitator]XP_037599413.1 ceramide-1-phosphate transfer protein isoform X2 [Cebus imitator]
MERLRGGPQRECYCTLQAMVAHELGSQLVDLERRSQHPESGCRTVLRLHRALHWLQLFLESLRTSPEDARTSVLCTDSYNASLAAHHPWIVRRAVTVAFCALPTRKVFLEAMNVGPPEQAVQMLGETTETQTSPEPRGWVGKAEKVGVSVQKRRGLCGMCGWRWGCSQPQQWPAQKGDAVRWGSSSTPPNLRVCGSRTWCWQRLLAAEWAPAPSSGCGLLCMCRACVPSLYVP